MHEGQIRDWLTKALRTIDDDVPPPDLVVVHLRAGPRSWPEHASISARDRTVAHVVEEVLGHVADCAASAFEEGRAGSAVRLRLYREGKSAGSRTFATAEADPEEGGDVGSETVAVIREMRLIIQDQNAHITRQAAAGWAVARQLLETHKGMVEERGELLIAAAAQDDSAMDKLSELASQVVPVILMKMAESKGEPA